MIKTTVKFTQKELDKEGITKDFLESIKMTECYSPVQLLPGDEPCHLLQCGSGYWVKDDNSDGYLKDKNGQLYIVSNYEARIGRARYLLSFKREVFEEKVQKEIIKLQKKVESYLSPVLQKVKEALINTGQLVDGNSSLRNALNSMVSEEKRMMLLEQSKQIVDLFPLEKYNYFKDKLDQRDFDELYQIIFSEGAPLLGSFGIHQMEELKELFHEKNIDATIQETEGKSHLYKVAYFNVKRKEAQDDTRN